VDLVVDKVLMVAAVAEVDILVVVQPVGLILIMAAVAARLILVQIKPILVQRVAVAGRLL
jgi:hypothetical protein